MFDNTLYFCFGDNRTRRKRYRIFEVNSLEKAHDVARALGYNVIVDETLKFDGIRELEERFAYSVLNAVHAQLHAVENTVSCIRRDKNLAEQLQKHFMKTPMKEYFPKLLNEPINIGTPQDPLFVDRREHEWMVDIIVREAELLEIEWPDEFPIIEADPRRGAFPLGERMEDNVE